MANTRMIMADVVLQTATLFIISILSFFVPCLFVGNGVWIGVNGMMVLNKYLPYYEFTDKVCTSSHFDTFGRYGFCESMNGVFDYHEIMDVQIHFHILIITYCLRIFRDVLVILNGDSKIDAYFRTGSITLSLISTVSILNSVHRLSIINAEIVYFPTTTSLEYAHAVTAPFTTGFSTIGLFVCAGILFLEWIFSLYIIYDLLYARKRSIDIL